MPLSRMEPTSYVCSYSRRVGACLRAGPCVCLPGCLLAFLRRVFIQTFGTTLGIQTVRLGVGMCENLVPALSNQWHPNLESW